MTLSLVYRPLARDDLDNIYDWLADKADPDTALGLVSAIEDRCARLTALPNGGTPRPEIGPGVRSVSFRKRAVIAYRVEGEALVIVGIMYGGRDLGALQAPGRLR